LGLFKYSYNRSNGEKEDIEQLLDLVVEERKYHRGLSTVVLCHHSRIPMVVVVVGGVAVVVAPIQQSLAIPQGLPLRFPATPTRRAPIRSGAPCWPATAEIRASGEIPQT
jgi:hypothetical protein